MMTTENVKTVLDDLARQKNEILDSAANELAKYLKDCAALGKTKEIYRNLFVITSEFTVEERNQIFALALQKMCMVTSNQSKAHSGGSFKGAEKTKFSGSGRKTSIWD